MEQRKSIDATLDRLNYKIARYEIAVETGRLTWDEPCQTAKDTSEGRNLT